MLQGMSKYTAILSASRKDDEGTFQYSSVIYLTGETGGRSWTRMFDSVSQLAQLLSELPSSTPAGVMNISSILQKTGEFTIAISDDALAAKFGWIA
jgi:hypothetical protein